MQEIVPFGRNVIAGERVQTVNARDLHAFLESRKDFSNWIKERISQYGFTEGRDFVCSTFQASNGRGGHNRIDYHVTVEMAKELAMVERNDKGKEARQYFIQCERMAKEKVNALAIPDFSNPAEAARAWADQFEARQIAQAKLEAAMPAVEFVERYVEAKSSKSLSDVAKVLGIKPRAFIAQLSDDGVIFKRGGSWIPFQQHIDSGRFSVNTGEANGHAYLQTRVEPKGVEWLARRYALNGSKNETEVL